MNLDVISSRPIKIILEYDMTTRLNTHNRIMYNNVIMNTTYRYAKNYSDIPKLSTDQVSHINK